MAEKEEGAGGAGGREMVVRGSCIQVSNCSDALWTGQVHRERLLVLSLLSVLVVLGHSSSGGR